MNERQKLLLQVIIEEYIRNAEPVSSKYLNDEYDFGLSTATIRAEMCALEDEGFLAQLHTSGGRVPTDKAYRYYVDTLEVGNIQLSERYKNKIHEAIDGANGDPRELNRIMAHVLSQLTGSVVITNIIGSSEYSKSGLASLFGLPEFQEAQRMVRLASFFDEFEEMVDRMHKFMLSERARHEAIIRVMIGYEHPFKGVNDDTIIQSEYTLPQKQIGSVTIIGPTRMDYERNLSLLRYTIDEMNKRFN